MISTLKSRKTIKIKSEIKTLKNAMEITVRALCFFPRTTLVCDLLNVAELNGDEITLLRVIHLNQIGIKSFK